MPYSCAHMATMGVKGLLKENKRKVVWGANGRQRVAYDMEQCTICEICDGQSLRGASQMHMRKLRN